MHTLTVLIPLFYNPDRDGARAEVESWRHKETEAEIRRYFGGYSLSLIHGWYRASMTGKECRDIHLRFEIDVIITLSTKRILKRWKSVLQRRFMQRSIYMRLSEQIFWI